MTQVNLKNISAEMRMTIGDVYFLEKPCKTSIFTSSYFDTKCQDNRYLLAMNFGKKSIVRKFDFNFFIESQSFAIEKLAYDRFSAKRLKGNSLKKLEKVFLKLLEIKNSNKTQLLFQKKRSNAKLNDKGSSFAFEVFLTNDNNDKHGWHRKKATMIFASTGHFYLHSDWGVYCIDFPDFDYKNDNLMQYLLDNYTAKSLHDRLIDNYKLNYGSELFEDGSSEILLFMNVLFEKMNKIDIESAVKNLVERNKTKQES